MNMENHFTSRWLDDEQLNFFRLMRPAHFKTRPQKKHKKKQEQSKKKKQAKKPSILASNNDLLTNQLPVPGEDEENDDEEMGVADTYADYMPSKLKLGGKHPDPVVETTSLSSVEPADIWYTLSLPDRVIESGALSALQLESITYAAQQHEHFLPDGTRAGFLVGDGAGVGKGRTIAGSIYENFLKGRKRAIWVSVSSDLKYDSERDLKDIGATGVPVYSLSKLKYAAISSRANGHIKEGVIFSTYSALIGKTSQKTVSFKTRLEQLVDWCGDDFEGLIVFDECHRAKNLCPAKSSKPTKTGMTVLDIQQKLPKARVLYASATGASEPRNMAYMTRLGIWGHGTPFRQFSDFISSVEMRGVGAMEIVAMDMKLRGIYIARQLSFHGVTFKIVEIPLSSEFVKVYDSSVLLWVELMQKFQEAEELMELENKKRKTMWAQFWASHQRFFKYLCIAAKVKHAVQVANEAVNCGNCVVIGLQSTGEARTLDSLEKEGGELSDFISTAKGVLENLVEKHFPAPESAKITHQSFWELGSLHKMKLNPLSSFSSNEIVSEGETSKGTKRRALRQTAIQAVKKIRKDTSDLGLNTDSSDKLSTHSTDKEDDYLDGISIKSNTSSNVSSLEFDSDSEDISKQPNNKSALCMRKDLLVKINKLGELLPLNTLDELINELGGPGIVAEMTGRKGRVVQLKSGQIQYETRTEEDVTLETLNLTEKQRFMNGEKLIAIISEAASSGISLQSDRRVINKRRRVHITLELPWSADRAIQQFGRTHRSNQVNAPEYIFLISNIAGERRFASIVAKRLESLGALTHGDRRATETTDLSRYNIVNKYGREALKTTMATIVGHEIALVKPPSEHFFEDISKSLVGVGMINNPIADVHILDKDHDDISKFLNRILGMSVEHQNQLFKYFTDTLEVITLQAKKAGKYDLGILDLGKAGENVKRVKLFTFLRKHATGLATTELHIVHVERGMSWEEAMKRWAQLDGTHEGFYLSHQIRSGKKTAVLAICSDKIHKLYTLFRPNTGLQLNQVALEDLQKKYKKVKFDAAEPSWTNQYLSSETTCSHAYWGGKCSIRTLGLDCEIGLRRRTYNVLSGSVLAVWTRVEEVLKNSSYYQKMQVVRLRIADDTKVVGTLIPKSSVNHLVDNLAADAEKMDEVVF